LADRFFYPGPPVNGRITLSGDEAHHLAKVRRLAPGAQVELFNGQSPLAMRAEVVTIRAREVDLIVQEASIEGREPPLPLTLATATPKGERFDWLVEKAVEIGVTRLVPLHSERSVVAPRTAKLDRQRRSVIEASKQCGRNRLMQIDEPTPLPLYLAAESAQTRLIAHPAGCPPADWLHTSPPDRAALLIGPEGGWTEAEVALARSLGWRQIGLGSTILRIETAALVASALVLALVDATP
jgi:16S rRNA (uracil1498-N3)-methyltransferase